MIERHWKGIAKPEEAANYVEHLLTDTFPKVSMINGFIKASILKKETKRGIEFLIVTTWESMEAMKKFAGEVPELAVVPDSVKKMMLAYDEKVAHYEVVKNYTRT